MTDIVEITDCGDDVISLWRQAFGDSREDILFFLNKCKNKSCLCLTAEKKLLSMLFLVDCTFNGKSYKYIYAACTENAAKKQGCMSSLLKYAGQAYGRLILIPANEQLVKYYLKRNFNHKADVKNILFNECSEIKEYLTQGCSLEQPFALANTGE